MDKNFKQKFPEKDEEIISLEKEAEKFFPDEEKIEEKEASLPIEKAQEIKKGVLEQTISDELQQEIEKEAKSIELLTEENKIKKLLAIAKHRENGVVYAIKIAQKIDPFVLDKLHDSLIEKGYYKNVAFSPITQTADLTQIKHKADVKKIKKAA